MKSRSGGIDGVILPAEERRGVFFWPYLDPIRVLVGGKPPRFKGVCVLYGADDVVDVEIQFTVDGFERSANKLPVLEKSQCSYGGIGIKPIAADMRIVYQRISNNGGEVRDEPIKALFGRPAPDRHAGREEAGVWIGYAACKRARRVSISSAAAVTLAPWISPRSSFMKT